MILFILDPPFLPNQIISWYNIDMFRCNFCGKPIPKNRIDKSHIPGINLFYCSNLCNKRAYYVRNLKSNQVSRFTDKKKWFKTETGKGWLWEKFVARLIGAKHQPFGNSFDLLYKNNKVDVKTANLYFRKEKNGKPIKNPQIGWWRFDRGTGQKNIDYFFCIGLIKNIPQKMFFIPNKNFGKRGVTISPKASKYDKYLMSL